MPTVQVPLFTKVYRNTDESVLTDDAAIQYNGFLDELDGLTVRPGEVVAVASSGRNDGLYMWPDRNYIVSVDNNAVRLRTVDGQELSNPPSSGAVTFSGGKPVIFCNDTSRVYMAGGGRINYITNSGDVGEITDPEAPTNVTHVGFLDQYILAINGTNKFFWSDIPTTTNWSALNFASAEANPDIIQGLYVIQRQVFLIGTVTTEIWENDGESPFSRIPGGLIEVGCAAKYSTIKLGNSLIWLNHDREFVKFTGTDVSEISSSYSKEIEKFEVVSDCIGGLVKKGGQVFCLFQFLTEGRTLAYNPRTGDWSEWGAWDSGGAKWFAYDFRASARDINSGQTFIGKSDAGVIACLDNDSNVDVIGSTTTRPVKFLRRTGFINHGTSKQKRIEEISFRAKRGATQSTSPKHLMFRYRDNGSTQWSNIRDVDLGAVGDTEHTIRLKRLGVCRSRQYEISSTDDIPIVLSNAEAEITVLR